uniref:Reverse transcriptase domain-containing protein n=1 Tax=Tanacetum cinerariifolium TaxID=118510 RepID=A0A6L2KLV7_TANCI|nr:hypothetical protein [Tanacetum cinerariifolium]GEU49156.1 hypothetical protein [Tanacetum cinerariifolium]GEW76656.1 hypothetical protein [Tanacetum cinerariifolium]
MSDLEDSTITYTKALPLPDYVSGLKEPEQAPPTPEFVLEPAYPEFMPPEDDVLPDKEILKRIPKRMIRILKRIQLITPPTKRMMRKRRSPHEMMLMIRRRIRTRTRRSSKLWLTLSHHYHYTVLQLGYPSYFRHLYHFCPRQRADVSEITLPPQKRLCIALGIRFKVSESSFALITRPTGGFRADNRFVGTLDNEIRRDPKRDRDIRAHARTTRLIKSKTRLSREAWVQSMDVSDTARAKVTSLENAPKRTTRSIPATTTTATTTPVTNVQLKALINQGIADALAARDANRSQNGQDSHDSRMGLRRQAPPARECTYHDFMKCKPLYFKGIEGVVELT